MKTVITLFAGMIICTLVSAQAVLRITKVNPVTHQVTITNMGNVSQVAATWNLCAQPEYDPLNSMVKISGSTTIAPGASLVVIWPFCNGTNGEVGLYANAADFGNPSNMRDYMEWGSSPHNREDEAVAGGYWTAGQFVPNDPEFNYIGTSTQHGSAFWTHETPGCTYSLACNFNAAATAEDGTCDFTSCTGCTSPQACNLDATATLDDGSCEYLSCRGCTSNEACNFDVSATKDDGSCEFDSCAGCTYSTAMNFDATATLDDGSCVYAVDDCPTDFNSDNTTSTPDLLIFLGAFGTACP
ncbi:MAG: hypothetical protein SH856_04550 [Flavobacteriales bacterium]|nr:hypothetical protein [Flavobacteriales bacterium]